MPDSTFSIIYNTVNYKLEFLDAGWYGPINSIYYLNFKLHKDAGQFTNIVIGVFDTVISMWGVNNTLDDLETFCLQIIPKLLETTKLDRDSVTIYIHRDDNVIKIEDAFYIKASPDISVTAKKITFENTEATNTAIRRKIVEVCYASWQDDPHGFVTKAEFIKQIPLTEVELERNIRYLNDSGYVDAKLSSGGYSHTRITNYGIDLFENPNEFNRVFSLQIEQHTLNVGGDYIVPVTIGNNNEIFIKSEIEEAFNNIIYTQKQENALTDEEESLTEQMKTEVLSKVPDDGKLKSVWDRLSILPNEINKKIISHPVISQIIAQLLLNQIPTK